MHVWRPHQRIVEYLHVVNFYGIFRVCNIRLDWALITAMVSDGIRRHTFRLHIGEATITLQNVVVLLGL